MREFVCFTEPKNTGVKPGMFFVDNEGYHPISEVTDNELKQEFNLFRDNPVTGRTISNLVKQGISNMRELYERVIKIHFGKLDHVPDIDGNILNLESQ